jgi:hypothetical protein
MPVNLRGGFLRIWLAVSALWLIIVAAFFYHQVISPHIKPLVYILPTANSDFYELENVYDPDFKVADQTRIEFPNNVFLFASNDIPKAVLDTRSKSFYEEYSKPRDAELTTARWQSLGFASAIGLLPPLALLLLGWVVGWIVSGFRSTSQKT